MQERVSETSSVGKRSRSPSPISNYGDVTNLPQGGRDRRLRIKKKLVLSRQERGRARGRGELRRSRHPITSPACPQHCPPHARGRSKFLGRVPVSRGRRPSAPICVDFTEAKSDSESSMEKTVSQQCSSNSMSRLKIS